MASPVQRAAWPRLGLVVEDWPDLARHLGAEYGPPEEAPAAGGAAPGSVAGAQLGVVVRRLRRGDTGDPGRLHRRRHKTTSWAIRLSDPEAQPIVCELEIRGLFGRSLVQSAIIEPLLATALSRRDTALVPAAAIVDGDRALLLAGASRSGKSSIAMRAWAAGRTLLGDDHVVVTPDGAVMAFPRRLRAYPDLARTAPSAHARLPPEVRRSLSLAGIVRRVSRGYVGLPVLVSANGIVAPSTTSAPLGRLVVVERRDGADTVAWSGDDVAAWRLLDGVVERDLASIAALDGAWAGAASRARARIVAIARRAAENAKASTAVLTVPGGWPAERAIEALEDAVGLGRRPA